MFDLLLTNVALYQIKMDRIKAEFYVGFEKYNINKISLYFLYIANIEEFS